MLKRLRVFFCALGVAGACLAADTTPAPTVVEEIVAKVNNEIVTRGEMDKYRRQVEAEVAHDQMKPERAQQVLKQMETDLLRDRIDQLLMVAKAKELDLKVDQDVSKQMASLQVKSGITDTDKFQQWVRDQSGMSFEDYKQQVKDGLLTQEVVRREVGGGSQSPKPRSRNTTKTTRRTSCAKSRCGCRRS